MRIQGEFEENVYREIKGKLEDTWVFLHLTPDVILGRKESLKKYSRDGR